jgi:hypothetical protein
MYKKLIIVFFKVSLIYLLISISLYTISAFALIYGKVLDIKLITEYQRNFYHKLGFRKIWQNQVNCVDYDKDLIFVAKLGMCEFNNVEFKTQLNFNEKGRVNSSNIYSNKKGVAVLGDSHAMGWGVNDIETFSYILENKIKRPVFNLAVSGYSTNRELLALKRSKLIDQIDTIIIQYSNNDFHENKSFSNNQSNDNYLKFQKLFSEDFSILKRFRKGIRYAITIPFSNNIKKIDWKNEEQYFFKILNSHNFIKEKKIILIYANGHEIYYENFNYNSNYIKNNNKIYFINIDYEKTDFYLVDGHLNMFGHLKIANALYKFMKIKNFM